LERAVAGADVVFFDGTFWTSDELPAAGLGTRRAEDMSHWPVFGSGGSLEPNGSLSFLSRLPARRRIFIHVNNTNPMLREDGPERAEVARHGVEVAFDGMELEL
ncbi:MAG TPA: pyrroloquinoline quinone biosynthesis protein B, partial [Polyangia bacterium]|nr:pyrroloquinoline quinone biosynthesis protein B [Polyangia bacterium]